MDKGTLKENISHYSLNKENIINISYENNPIYKGDREEGIMFYLPVGTGNGNVMALLLSGITRGTGKRGSPD